MSLLKGATRNLKCNQEAEKTVSSLNEAFTTVLILKHPNPEVPFIVEVHASEIGVGPILSQRFGDKPKMHPVAFFSYKLSAAERNYDIGNRELLAVNQGLKRHCGL